MPFASHLLEVEKLKCLGCGEEEYPDPGVEEGFGHTLWYWANIADKLIVRIKRHLPVLQIRVSDGMLQGQKNGG